MSISNWFGNSKRRATRLSEEEQEAFFRRIDRYLPRDTDSDSPPADRRNGKRVAATDLRIFLGWIADDDFHLIAADVINISPGGLMAYVEGEAPASEEVVWVRRESGTQGESRRAVILEVRPEGIGEGRTLRLRFDERDATTPHARAGSARAAAERTG